MLMGVVTHPAFSRDRDINFVVSIIVISIYTWGGRSKPSGLQTTDSVHTEGNCALWETA